jgi:hypothetical protein
MAQHRSHEEYLVRLRQQQRTLRQERNDYDRDPAFYTPSTYRYQRGGRSYETNDTGAQTLQKAVNYGYREGVRAGKADRVDGWRGNYRNSYAYKEADYGYSGYIDRGDYNNYFREGFRPGYEDGYNAASRHGGNTDGQDSMWDNILSEILKLQLVR